MGRTMRNPVVPIVNRKEMNFWNYFLNLESDLNRVFNFIEPVKGNFKVYSSELVKIIILACTEFENVTKVMGNIDKKTLGNMSQYKEYFLSEFSEVWLKEVSINGYPLIYKPFENWPDNDLDWWSAYTGLKHNRHINFSNGTLKNALDATGALLISLVYYYHRKRN